VRTVIFFARAKRDLDDIWAYIAVDNLTAADRFVEDVGCAVQDLAVMPGLGHRRPDVSDPRYRFWSVKKHLIAYRHTSRTLRVVRIVHGARDIRKVFDQS